MSEVVVVLARGVTIVKGLSRNSKIPEISKISKTQKSQIPRILYFQGFLSFLEIYKS
jgi:hypothetical protein